MRSVWRGSIVFGLVTIPVRLYAAAEERVIPLHQVHDRDAGRVRYQRVCSVCKKEIDYSNVAKGHELSSGDMVVLTDEDFDRVPIATSKTAEVVQFAPANQIDPAYYSKTYYAEPDRGGAKPYTLFREALQRGGVVGIVKITLRRRESLAIVRAREGVLALETLMWPEELRSPDFDFLDEDIEIRRQEIQMATSLVESMIADFDPTQFKDEYRQALQEVIDAKVEGREVSPPERREAEEEKAVDLVSALEQSVEAAKQQRKRAPGKEKPKRRRRTSSSRSSSGKRNTRRERSRKTA